MAFNRRFHRSGFLTLAQPRRFQPSIQRLLKASTTYLLSLTTRTAQLAFNASNPTITAMSSMRLLVVWKNPPLSSFSLAPLRKIAP